jgi:DmsE family decaheme c-type cytochrome
MPDMTTTTKAAGLGVGICLLLLWLGIGAVSARGAGRVPVAVTDPSNQAAGATGAQPAVAVTSDTCLTCHDRAGETRLHEYHKECLTCHTGAAIHVAEPEKANIGLPKATQCLTCHSPTMKATWSFGPHAKADVACASCHTMHASRTATGIEAREKRVDAVSTKCVTCHKDVAARFRLPSHHPVNEGAMSCTSCHNPHTGNNTGVKREVEKCGTCHQAQRTPKAVVHPPVVENCSTCHNPHGSPNRRLLAMAMPTLCIQCHSIADNRHALGSTTGGALGGAMLRNCVSCHKAIHGSQIDPHLRF